MGKRDLARVQFALGSLHLDLGATCQASHHFTEAAWLLRAAGDERAEAMERLARDCGALDLDYRMDLAWRPPVRPIEAFGVSNPTPLDVLELAPTVEAIFGGCGARWAGGFLRGGALLHCSFAAYNGPELAGACLVGRRNRYQACVWALFVKTEHRGRGLGRALLVRSLGQLAEGRYRLVQANIRETNAASRRTFESAGFVQVHSRLTPILSELRLFG